MIIGRNNWVIGCSLLGKSRWCIVGILQKSIVFQEEMKNNYKVNTECIIINKVIVYFQIVYYRARIKQCCSYSLLLITIKNEEANLLLFVRNILFIFSFLIQRFKCKFIKITKHMNSFQCIRASHYKVN